LYAAYLLSGFAAVVYEIVWARELTQVIGASLYAVSTVTGLFLGGLALGAAAAGRLCARQTWSATAPPGLRMFAAFEIIIAAYGILMPVAFRADTQEALWSALSIGDPTASTVARILYAALLIVPATAFMGATFPVLVAAVGSKTARGAEWLYTVNTIGGAAGALGCGFLLLPQLGLQASSWLAAGLHIVAAIVSIMVARRCAEVESPPDAVGAPDNAWNAGAPGPPPDNDRLRRQVARTAIIGALFSGLLFMVYEIVSMRLLSLVLGSSTYSMSTVLALLIAGLAVGSALSTRFLLPWRQPLLLSAAVLTACAVYGCVFIYSADGLPWSFLATFKLLQAIFPEHIVFVSLLSRVAVASLVVAVPSLLSGMVFPLLLSIFDEADKARRTFFVGLLSAANNAGCIAGAFITGFVLIPKLGELFDSGMQASLILYVCLLLTLSMYLFAAWSASYMSDKETRALTIGVAAFVAFAVMLDMVLFKPAWDKAMMSAGPSFYSPSEIARANRDQFVQAVGSAGGAVMLFYREGLNSTITVEALARNNVMFLKNDGKVEAALPIVMDQPAPTSDIKTHIALAEVPLSAPGKPHRDLLLIGYGSGTTAGVLANSGKVSQVTIAELEPAIFACSHFFAPITGDPIAKSHLPGSNILAVLNDGRYVLASRTTAYDAIVCQPSDPWVNGSSDLFTEEFFRLVKRRLSTDGTFCQWVQLYSIDPARFGVLCRTFISVFSHGLLYHDKDAGECLLLAPPESANPEDLVKELRGRRATVVDSAGIKQMCRRLALQTAEARLNTDDNLIVEFAAAAGAVTQESEGISENIQWIERYAK